jgi:hypothetical protein
MCRVRVKKNNCHWPERGREIEREREAETDRGSPTENREEHLENPHTLAL